MFRALSSAASGMQAEQLRLDVAANNIANVSTPGFKKNRIEFEDLMYQVLRAPGSESEEGARAPTGVQIGQGVRVAGTDRLHSQGEVQQTGNPLDVGIEGAGFFPIKTASGETLYTRDGSFKVSAEGRMVNAHGLAIAADVTLPPDAQSVTIAADGAVSVQVPGETAPVSVGRIDLATFANPAGLVAAGKNLLRESVASGTAVLGAPGENGTGALAQGQLEMSNVQIVEEMVDLIAGQRAYEINARVIRAADEMLQQTSNMK